MISQKSRILVADDDDINRTLLVTYLNSLGYNVSGEKTGKSTLEKIMKEKPDVILLDINMPGMDGFDILKVIKSNPDTRMIPVIIITGISDNQYYIKAIELGADDFLLKPFNIYLLKARLHSLVSMKMLYDINLKYQKKLKESNFELLNQLVKTQEVTIVALAKLAEFRDPETGGHLERIREYSKILVEEITKIDKYKKYINEKYISNIYKSAPLHDIGKVGIPDSILLKPGKLTKEEFEIMKSHSTIGGNAISSALKQIGIKTSFLDMAKFITYYHHERWDGGGYPFGLKGEDIPLSARVISLADVYDALTSKRIYKDAFSHGKAKTIIVSEAGKQFDPDIVDAFLKRENDFLMLKEAYKDKNNDQETVLL